MNDLNTQQIVLLCILVSFVSSIATGITTVSLLGQSPEPVSQTINRVVEKTIERVVETADNKPPERIVETVVVNQEDLTVDAVAKNSKSIVRLYTKDASGQKVFFSLGIIVNNTGRVVTISGTSPRNKLLGVFDSGEFELKLIKSESPFGLYEPATATVTTFSPATLGDSQSLKLAQSVVLVSGRNSNIVAAGIINDLVVVGGDSETKDYVTKVVAGVDSTKVITGSVILNLKGEIVGINSEDIIDPKSFVPINSVKSLISFVAN